MHQMATAPPDLMAALSVSLTPTRTARRLARLCPAPAHGGYPGDVIVHETYLQCPDCSHTDVLPDYGGTEWCYRCGTPMREDRVHPAPEFTIRLPLYVD